MESRLQGYAATGGAVTEVGVRPVGVGGCEGAAK